MDFQEILDKVFEATAYPVEKREAFRVSFFELMYMRLVSEVRGVNKDAADKVLEATSQGASAEALAKVFEDISTNPRVSAKINEVTEKLVTELVNDLAKDASEADKKRILEAIIPSAR